MSVLRKRRCTSQQHELVEGGLEKAGRANTNSLAMASLRTSFEILDMLLLPMRVCASVVCVCQCVSVCQ